MALALELGFPSWRALLQCLTSEELTEWMEFFEIRDERFKALAEKRKKQ